MQFYAAERLIWLWMLPVLLLVFFIARRVWHKRMTALGNLNIIRSKLMPQYRPAEWHIKNICLFLAFLFAILALARPQWGDEQRKIERKGIDIVVLLDTSLSMLSEDVPPNRLEKAKLEIKNMVRRLKGDRIGMVAFAGSSFLQAPLTLDYSAFFLFLDAIKTGYIPDPGTSLDRAIRLAMRAFTEKELKHKAVIIFTDGEDHEGGIEAAIAEAQTANVRVYCIGVGTVQGAPIPLKGEGGQKTGFKKDKAGQVVITKLNPPLLEKIATETGGLYLPSTPGEEEIEIILKHLASLGQKRFKERMVTEREDHFQLFLTFALLFLIAEMLISRKAKRLAQPLAMIAVFFLFCGFLDSPKGLVDKGNEAYKNKKYQTAMENYRKAQVKKPEDAAIHYNLASTHYQMSEYQQASQELQKINDTVKDPELKAKAYYNLGNTQYRLGNFDKAIESYQKALEIDPKDKDAKYNLEFLQKQKSMFEKKDQERKNDQQKQNQQKNQQQQNQQQQQQNQQQQQQDQQQNQDQSGQDEKDQQQNQQNQDQQDQQDQQQQNKPDQSDQKDKANQDQQDQNQPKPEQGEEKKDQNQQQQGEQPKPQGGEEQKEQQAPKPLQGQMTLPDALRVLDALKESEKELQDLRRPPVNREPNPVDKDW